VSEQHRILSFGGGVQSHALLALLGQGRYPGLPPQEVWFCDPRNERPQTYAFIERVTKPYCARIGVPFVTLERHVSPSRGPDLREAYQRRAAYPLRSNRVCTIEWKINVMRRECKRRGWHRSPGVEKHIGISLDELHRARSGQDEDWEAKRYPLIEARLFRDDCVRICHAEFGAAPVKSGCWFCKYQRPAQWREVYEARADGRWHEAVEWERAVIARRGLACVFVDALPKRTLEQWAALWERGKQLPLALAFLEEGACDGGYCML